MENFNAPYEASNDLNFIEDSKYAVKSDSDMRDFLNLRDISIYPCTFINNSAICWFNSLIQMLLSSKNFLRVASKYPENHILKTICDLSDKRDVVDISSFATYIVSEFRRLKLSFDISNEDTHEALLYLLEVINVKEIEGLFKLVYKEEIKCGWCDNVRASTVTEHKYISIYSSRLNLKEIARSVTKLEDMVCTSCKSKDICKAEILDTYPSIFIFLTPEINKKEVQFASTLTFKGDLEIKYKLHSVIKYTGSSMSGHYYLYCKRESIWYLINDTAIWEKKPELDIHNRMFIYDRI